jgi:hypothetical protein
MLIVDKLIKLKEYVIKGQNNGKQIFTDIN